MGKLVTSLLFLVLAAGVVSADLVSGPAFALRTDLFALAGWLVYAVCAFLIGVLCRADLKNVGAVLAVFLIGYGAFGLCCIDPLFGPLLVVVGLSSVGLGYALGGRIRGATHAEGDEKLTKNVRVGLILFFVVVGFVAQFAIVTFRSSSPSRFNRGAASGFPKLKPQLVGSFIQADGNGSLIFTNGAGAPIDVLGVGITDLVGGGPECVIGPDRIQPSSHIAAGDNLVVTGLPSECTKTGKPGEVWALSVRINYNLTIGGIPVFRNESGTLRGPRT
jgi:hypothetical protein